MTTKTTDAGTAPDGRTRLKAQDEESIMTLSEQLEQMIGARWKGVHPETREEVFGYALATLDAVQREAENHLYTNTKNGNRQAMLNIVARLRQSLTLATRTSRPEPVAAPLVYSVDSFGRCKHGVSALSCRTCSISGVAAAECEVHGRACPGRPDDPRCDRDGAVVAAPPAREMVLCSLRYPDYVCHLAHPNCAHEAPHHINDCGRFMPKRTESQIQADALSGVGVPASETGTPEE